MFFVVLFIAVILVAVIIYLPYLSGLVSYKVDKVPKRGPVKKNEFSSSHVTESYGYIPPDEQISQSSAVDGIWKKARLEPPKINVTSDDIPIKLTLKENSGLKRRHKEKLDIDSNPNNYDYDLDELIREESEAAIAEQRRQFYNDAELGKEKEAMV